MEWINSIWVRIRSNDRNKTAIIEVIGDDKKRLTEIVRLTGIETARADAYISKLKKEGLVSAKSGYLGLTTDGKEALNCGYAKWKKIHGIPEEQSVSLQRKILFWIAITAVLSTPESALVWLFLKMSSWFQ